MKKIIAINASLRTTWNTASLVREAAKGAESEGAEVSFLTCINWKNSQDVFPVSAANCPDTLVSACAKTVLQKCLMR